MIAIALIAEAILGAVLAGALIVLAMVACTSTDHRDVRVTVRAILAILVMMGALLMVVEQPCGCRP